MKHLRTLVFIMVTMAVVFGAPHSPAYQSKRTSRCNDTNLQKKEIHIEAERLMKNLTDEELHESVRKPRNHSDYCVTGDKNKDFFCELAHILHGKSHKFCRMRQLLDSYLNNTHCKPEKNARNITYELRDLLNETLSCSRTQR